MALKKLVRSGNPPSTFKTQIHRWVIIGPNGLYVGQQQTRADMIALHVGQRLSGMTVDGQTFPDLPCQAWGGLSDDQRQAWAWCRKMGDRCVHAAICY